MTRTVLAVAASVAVLTLLGGCSGSTADEVAGSAAPSSSSSSSQISTSSPTSAPSSSENPSATPTAQSQWADPSEYANVLKGEHKLLRKDFKMIERCSKGDWERGPGTCGLAALGFATEAWGLAQDLEFETSRIALPAPPGVAGLIQQSYFVFDAVQAAEERVADCQGFKECDDAWFALYLAAEDVIAALDSWATQGT